jgi:hydroxyacylglutathione hydrolase
MADPWQPQEPERSITPIAAFRDNYVWLISRGDQAVVVDPGDDVPVRRFLLAHHLRLRAILLTHHHADHVGGVLALVEACDPGTVVVYGPAGEAIAGVDRKLKEGDHIELPSIGMAFEVLDVPGHTRGHIAYVSVPRDGEAPWLFCGDTLFASGCGRLFEGTAAQMHASLGKLASLPGETRVYCAHEYTAANLRFARAVEPGNPELIAREHDVLATRSRNQPTLPSTIALERATNPFLRTDVPDVREAADRHAAGAGQSSLAAFTALRQWKDSY